MPVLVFRAQTLDPGDACLIIQSTNIGPRGFGLDRFHCLTFILNVQ